jgi:hypothetical protein
VKIVNGGTPRRRAWRGTRLGWLGLLPAAGILLATMATAPAGASELSQPAARATRTAHHLSPTGTTKTLAQAPAGLRAAIRATLGQPTLGRAGDAAGGQAATLAPADHQADFFGVSIAVSGNTALIGATTAHHHTGAVYVFVHRAGGWTQQARLTAADGVAKDNFGFSVALDGNTAVIGASNRGLDGVRSFHGVGGAYVFVRTGTTWSQQALLLPPAGTSSGEFFGFSVGISGSTVLVGAPGDALSRGAVFEFTRTGTTWSQQSVFTGSNSVQDEVFGWSLAFSGGLAVVGAPQEGGFTGEAYVFTQSGTGFTQRATLVGPHREGGDLFGRSVALSGTTALIGSPGVNALTGAAYVFVQSGTHWARQAALTAADGQQLNSLGEDALAVSGNTAVVGADPASSFTGAGYEFVRPGCGHRRWDRLARRAWSRQLPGSGRLVPALTRPACGHHPWNRATLGSKSRTMRLIILVRLLPSTARWERICGGCPMSAAQARRRIVISWTVNGLPQSAHGPGSAEVGGGSGEGLSNCGLRPSAGQVT